jgi:hypothetical protein
LPTQLAGDRILMATPRPFGFFTIASSLSQLNLSAMNRAPPDNRKGGDPLSRASIGELICASLYIGRAGFFLIWFSLSECISGQFAN